MMSLVIVISSILLLISAPAAARGPHVITASVNDLRPSSLAWDPTAQHFVVANHLHLPTTAAVSVSDAGVVESILTVDSPATSIAIDDVRRRLLLALSNPPAVACFDLRSPRPHSRIFLTPLPVSSSIPGGLTVDPYTGVAFITADNLIYRIDPDGGAISILSNSSAFSDGGLSGAAIVRGRAILLVAQPSTRKLFKVDSEDGAARAVALAGPEGRGLTPPGAADVAVAVRSDGTTVVSGGTAVRMVESGDSWSEAAVTDEVEFEGAVRGVAVRDGKRAYVLVVEEGKENNLGKFRVEEVEWRRGGDGDMVLGMVLLGLGFAYFLYWRFQMGQLVSNMNKKRE